MVKDQVLPPPQFLGEDDVVEELARGHFLLRKIQKLNKLGVRMLQSLEDEKLQIRLEPVFQQQKLTVSNVLKTLELFLKDMVMTRRRRRRRMMQGIQSLLLLRRSLETCFPQLGPWRRRPRQ
jgi:hypothetical protein